MLTALLRLTVRHPLAVLLLHVALLVTALATVAWRTGVLDGEVDLHDAELALYDNAIERVWGTSPGPLRRYRDFLAQYGTDEAIAWVVQGEGVRPDGADLLRLQGFVEAVEARPEFPLEVAWLADLPYAPESLVFGEAPPPEELAPFYATLDADPSGTRFLRSTPAGWTVALVVAIDPASLTDASRQRLAPLLRETWAATDPPPAWRADGMGQPVLLGQLRTSIVDSMRVNLPMVNLVVLLICALVFRRPRPVLMAVGTVLVGEVLAIALFVGSGRSFNYVSCFMAISIVVVGFATVIHLFVRYAEERLHLDAPAAILAAGRAVARPSGTSVLTTCAGLLSLVTADQEAIRDFGVFSAAGMAMALVCTFTLGPALVVLFDRGDGSGRRAPSLPDAARVGVWAWHHPHAVLAGAALLAAVGAFGLTRLELGSNIKESFVASSPVTQSMDFVRERFGGFMLFELMVDWPDRPPAGPDEAVARVRDIEQALVGQLEDRGRPLTGADILSAADLARSFCLARPASCEDGWPRPGVIEALVEELPEDQAVRLLHEGEFGWGSRLTVVLDLPYAREGVEQAERIEALAQAAGGPGTSARVTGLAALWSHLEAAIVHDLLRSFALGSAVIVLLLGLVLRSGRALAVSLPANALPLLLVFGAAGLVSEALGYHINSTSAMVLSVSVGIIVDDTLYFLLGYEDRLRRGLSSLDATRETLRAVGGGIVLSSVCLAVGFATLAPSTFVNSRIVGLLASATITVALFSDLLLLPALCRLFRPKA